MKSESETGMRLGLISNLLSFLLITALTGLVSFFLRRAGLGTSDALVLWVVSLVILLLLFYSYRQRLWLLVSNKLVSIAIKRFGEKIGLAQVYNNFEEASSDIKHAFEEAREARILIQLGRGIIGGNRSLLFESAKKKKERGFQMKLLYADRNSPQLSHRRAGTRDSNYKEWTAAISYTEGSIEALLEDGIHVEARRHCEPYLWRLFFFDEALFFVPYLVDKDNSAQAPIFKFIINDKNRLSLYKTFSEYFDYIWKKQEAESYAVKKTEVTS